MYVLHYFGKFWENIHIEILSVKFILECFLDKFCGNKTGPHQECGPADFTKYLTKRFRTEAATRGVLQKCRSQKFLNIHRKIPLLEFFFRPTNLLKIGSNTGVFL